MCLRCVFLLALGMPAWLRLSRRFTAWKDAQIPQLRHQIKLLERRNTARQKLTRADCALFAAFLAVIPRARHTGLHLPVTPATIVRWHRDLANAAGPQNPSASPPAAHNDTLLSLESAELFPRD
jgi:hypothetical protein